VDEASEFSLPEGVDIQTDGMALLYYSNSATGKADKPATIAWHDRTSLVIQVPAGCEQMRLEYHPDLRNQDLINRMRNKYADQSYLHETIFDWRGYFGPNTAILDG
jgi:hypothetical protein